VASETTSANPELLQTQVAQLVGTSAARAIRGTSATDPTVGSKSHCRRPLQRSAMSVKRWPVDHRVTGAAMPTGVPATAVSEAGFMPDEDPVGAEGVPVWAPARWVADPLAVGGLR
jgi:hypothetical protein